MLTAKYLREILTYAPDTGLFTWKKKKVSDKVRVGNIAGTLCRGYVAIRISKVRYQAHRLAWLYVTGKWPIRYIDHINGIRDDNRFCNLRDVDVTTNAQNIGGMKACGTSTGLLGAYLHKSGRFVSFIRYGGKKRNLGYLDTADDAHAAYIAAKTAHHKGFVKERVL